MGHCKEDWGWREGCPEQSENSGSVTEGLGKNSERENQKAPKHCVSSSPLLYL